MPGYDYDYDICGPKLSRMMQDPPAMQNVLPVGLGQLLGCPAGAWFCALLGRPGVGVAGQEGQDLPRLEGQGSDSLRLEELM